MLHVPIIPSREMSALLISSLELEASVLQVRHRRTCHVPRPSVLVAEGKAQRLKRSGRDVAQPRNVKHIIAKRALHFAASLHKQLCTKTQQHPATVDMGSACNGTSFAG